MRRPRLQRGAAKTVGPLSSHAEDDTESAGKGRGRDGTKNFRRYGWRMEFFFGVQLVQSCRILA
ncbi:MAG: hypothetical protein JG774_805 [Desulfomicrobiaceae bacterium]|jgi:hypothetical protein|nr:hypothetical protein [Desulfomicrobiaceae bacterium]